MFLKKPTTQYLLFLLLLVLAMLTTLGSVDDGGSSGVVNISGTISLNSETQVDSDVNDIAAPYAANDSIAQAQVLKNPVTVGGFVATSNSVSIGRLSDGGSDVQDYYAISLVAQQEVYFFPGASMGVQGDASTCKTFDVKTQRLCVALEDSNGNAVPFTEDSTNSTFIIVTPQNSGNYYLRVQAEQGAKNYIVATGLPSTAIARQAAATNEMSIDDRFIPGEVIVKFNNNVVTVSGVTSAGLASATGLVAKAGAPGRSMLMSLGDRSNRATTLSMLGVVAQPQHADVETQLKQDTIDVVKALRQRSDVEYAALNYLRQPLLEPDDTYYGLQWHYRKINLPLAWERTTGNTGVVVAVLDSGVLNHPDLQASLVQGYDFISGTDNAVDGDGIDNDPTDPGDTDGITPSSYHGTHVAGTVAAVSDNNSGVAGVAWNVKVMPLRVCGLLGCSDYDIQQALLYAAGLPNDSGTVPAQIADVVNLSLGAPTSSTVAPPAFVAARNAGVIVVAASGNESSSELFAPAAYNGVVSVSAVDYAGDLAFYSNRGNTIDVAAPGGDVSANLNGGTYPDGILSTVGSDQSGVLELGYGFYQGTSMAAPHVAGVVALMKSVKPDMTPDEFDQWLSNGDLTEDIGAAGRDDFYGYGLIDAAKAVAAASDLPIISPPMQQEPLILVSVNGLKFTSAVNELSFEIFNGGQDDLIITDPITDDSGGWLTITPVNVDANGVGTYVAAVDRSQLPGLATAGAVITIQANATNAPFHIPVMVYAQEIVSDAGVHYVLLYDIDAGVEVAQFDATIANGQYQFSFSNVPPGNYYVYAGNDSNSDNRICSSGEACGAYATLGDVTKIVIESSSDKLKNINFTTGFNPFLSDVQQVLYQGNNGLFIK